MAPLTLHLHGTARVVTADGREVVLERRAAALCALAALAPGIARERVAAWLWPDSTDARRNLRQQLVRFRQQFGQPLVAGQDRLDLAPDVALAPADGELLAGHEAGDDEFGVWLAAQREAQAGAQRARWQQALDEAEAAGDLDTALSVAAEAVRQPGAGEDAWQALMRVHYLRGDAAAGLAVHDRLTRHLQAGHGRAPSAATAALADALRRQRMAPGRAAPTALPAVLKRPPVLAGRDAELGAVRAALAQGRAVLLEGEAGLGKSRLLTELAPAGALCGAGRPGDAGAPYATLARWLAPLLAAADDGAHDAAERRALALLRPGAPAGTALLRGSLDQAVSALLGRCGVAWAVLDDLHFADAATLDLVAALAARPDPPRRWLFATRPTESPPAALALRDGLVELHRLDVVALSPMDEPATALLVDALALPGLEGAALAPALVRHTGGNPLYLLETLTQGLQDGSLVRGELPRPAHVGALIERRLQRLSEPALTLARVAAIAGVDFSIELAEAATGQRAVQLASAWQELQDAQVLRDEAFAHDLVADAALRSVPPVVARRVHVQCAQWLAAQGVEPARLGWHWRHGGMPAEAGRLFVAAAKRAEQAARVAEEAELYRHAADAFAEAGLDDARFDALCDRVRSLRGADLGALAMQETHALVAAARTDLQRLRARSELCGMHTERGELDEAVAVGQEAMTLARRLDARAPMVRVACHLATALCRLGRAAEAVALLAPLRNGVDAQPDDELRMLWHGDWGSALGHVGRLGEAVAAYDTALAASRRAGLRWAEGQLLKNCAVTLRQAGQFDRALAMSREGQALAVAAGEDADSAPIGRLVVARDEAESGLFASALPELEALVGDFERTGAAFWAQAARMVLARLWLDLGQHARAVPLLRDEPDGLPAWLRADRRLLRLELCRALDEPAPPGLLADALGCAAADPQRDPMLRVRALRHQAPAQVLAEAPALADALRSTERLGALMGLQVHVARAALALGRADDAGAAARAVLDLFEQGCAPDSMYRAEAWCVAASALLACGLADEADRVRRCAEQWLRTVALPQVPAAFLDSFLHRNAVNRELLSAARSRQP